MNTCLEVLFSWKTTDVPLIWKTLSFYFILLSLSKFYFPKFEASTYSKILGLCNRKPFLANRLPCNEECFFIEDSKPLDRSKCFWEGSSWVWNYSTPLDLIYCWEYCPLQQSTLFCFELACLYFDLLKELKKMKLNLLKGLVRISDLS